MGRKGSSFLTILFIGFCFIFSFVNFILYLENYTVVYYTFFNWICSGILNLKWGFLFDSVSNLILIVVTTISFFVHLYSWEYINADPHLPRFISYLSLFTFFIIILITASNFIQMFVGWEGVGLSSYLLINFWFTRIQANKAAIKAIIINRIGDIGLAIGIFFIFYSTGTTDYSVVFSLLSNINNVTISLFGFYFSAVDLCSFLIFIGAVGKSAQLGLHTWLPDAIEGPTPVSALIHAATIVTAGVFLIVRSSPLFEISSNVLNIVAIFGSITAVFAASVGLVQNDIKKIIAYSTCSQLGYIIFATGISSYSISFFHLFNHAFFKALLFLGAGSVIHAIGDEQDIRKIGGLKKFLPITYSTFLSGSLALAGFPFLSGFYSKDAIMEATAANYTNVSILCYFLGAISAFITAYYSIRLLTLVFLVKPRGYKKIYESAIESQIFIKSVLILLSIFSIFIGFLTKNIFLGESLMIFDNAIFFQPWNFFNFKSEFIPIFFKLIPTILGIIGLVLSYFIIIFFSRFIGKLKLNKNIQNVYTFLNKKWFFDRIYNEWFGLYSLLFSFETSYKIIDRGLVEKVGPYGLSTVINSQAKKFKPFHLGNVYIYFIVIFLSILIGLIFLIVFVLNPNIFLFKDFITFFLIMSFIILSFGA